MVQAPDVQQLIAETDAQEALENSGKRFARKIELMSELSQARVKDVPEIPEFLQKGQFSISASKKSVPQTALVSDKLDDIFPTLKSRPEANYFVELQDDLLTNTAFTDSTSAELSTFNR